jgi:FkbM family methyltransferase
MKTPLQTALDHLKGDIPENLKKHLCFFKQKAAPTPIAVERAEQIFYINYLREGMVVFDVGANIGELTLLFSRFVQPCGKVFSFEACKATFDKLSAIADLSGRDNVALHHLALTDSNGTAELYVYPEKQSGWNTLADRPLASYGIDIKPVSREQVSASTLDAFCQEHGIGRIDLLKIDVEGAEHQVLLGARRMLEQKKVGCCVFEFGGTTFDMGNTPAMIEGYLAQVGYEVRNIMPEAPCFPGRESALSAKFSIHVAKPK